MKEQFSKYILDQPSGLEHNIPNSAYTGFDPDDIEEGRLYFWIKENGEDILDSQTIFFVLQSRSTLSYFISEITELKEFNTQYNIDEVITDGYRTDFNESIESLLVSVKNDGFREISQEEIIQFLTGKETSWFFAQQPVFSIYTNETGFDVYKGMIQSWLWDEESGMHYATAFFADEASQKTYLNKQLKLQLHTYGGQLQTKKSVQYQIDNIKEAQQKNRIYLSSVDEKRHIVQSYPKIKKIIPKDEFHAFMEIPNLKINEGNYEVSGDFQFDAEKNSMLITGDLIVNGTLYFEGKRTKNTNMLIVLGDIISENYIHGGLYHFIGSGGDLKVNNITYLPAASRSWTINVIGQISTNTLVHAKTHSIKDDGIIFSDEFTTEITGPFVEELFGKNGHFSKKTLFEYLKMHRSIFKEHIPDHDYLERKKSLLFFKSYLRNWGSLYYQFAGFESLNVNEEDYNDCLVGGGDEVLSDVRGQSGRYCMNHENLEIIPLQANQAANDIRPTSVQLAYRFAWIMWTFSSWEHMNAWPLDYWKDAKQIDKAFENGKNYYQDDPHLALYWILHFGLLNDPRYEDIKVIMEDSKNELVMGAIAFIDDSKAIEEYKIENTPLQARLQKIMMRLKIEEASSTKEKVSILLSQFNHQPDETLILLKKTVDLNAKTDILEYLDTHPYQVGYSYLHALYENQDFSKWASMFIQESWEHLGGTYLVTPNGVVKNEHVATKTQWKKTAILLDMLEPVFDQLSVINQDKALTIIVNCGADKRSKNKARIASLQKRHKAKFNGEAYDPVKASESTVSNITPNQFRVENFAKILKKETPEDQLLFIKAAMNQDKFASECKYEGTICPYFVILWLEEMFKGKASDKEELISELVDHYDLNYERYKNENPMRDLDEKDQQKIQPVMKKYLKPS